LFAAVRSVVNTGKRQGLTAYQSIQQALSIDGSLFSLVEQLPNNLYIVFCSAWQIKGCHLFFYR
jgi:hypothetical protein